MWVLSISGSEDGSLDGEWFYTDEREATEDGSIAAADERAIFGECSADITVKRITEEG